MKLSDLTKNLKEKLKFSSKNGMYLPAAYDGQVNKPSVTLLFFYITFVLAVSCNIYLVITDVTSGTWTAITFWTMAGIFYLIRKLNKAKVDLDDKSIELDGGDDNVKS